MSDKKPAEVQIPDMSQLEIEDVFPIVLGVPPEREEIVIYENGEDNEDLNAKEQ